MQRHGEKNEKKMLKLKLSIPTNLKIVTYNLGNQWTEEILRLTVLISAQEKVVAKSLEL